MADENVEETEKSTSKEQRNQNKDLDRVTDYSEDSENLDVGKAQQKLKNILASEKKEGQNASIRDKELAAISIKKEDIDLIVNELEVTNQIAERALRENKGIVLDALQQLINI